MTKNRKCDVDGCEVKHYGKGFCKKHLYRFDRFGSPNLPKQVPAGKVLTHERVRYLLNYDPKTGSLTWKPKHLSGRKAGEEVGTIWAGRYQVGIDRKHYRSARIIWFWMAGEWPEHSIDHINGNPLDNRWCNLRDVTTSINNQNQRKPHKRGSTGYLGVTPSGKKFVAQIRYDGKRHYLGTYTTAKEASEAYLKEKRKFHEGCTI